MPERALQIGDGGFGERIDERALGAPRPGFARRLCERGGQLRLQFLAQLPLEIRIAEKTELGDKPQDSRRAHASAFGEFGHRGQSRRGIIRQQDLCSLALLRRQGDDRSADVFRDGRAVVDRRRFSHGLSLHRMPCLEAIPCGSCNENYNIDKCRCFGIKISRTIGCVPHEEREAPTVGRSSWTRRRPPAFQRLRSQSNEPRRRRPWYWFATTPPTICPLATDCWGSGRMTSSNIPLGTRARWRSAAASPRSWTRR